MTLAVSYCEENKSLALSSLDFECWGLAMKDGVVKILLRNLFPSSVKMDILSVLLSFNDILVD